MQQHVVGRGESLRVERVEARPEQGGTLHGQLEQLALHAHARVDGGRLGRALLPALLGAADLGDALHDEPLVHEAEPPVEVDGVALAQAGVLDAGHDRRRGVERGDLALVAAQVVAGDRAPDRELEQRLAAGDQVAHGGVALLDPQVARVEPVALHRDVGLRDELLLVGERPQRRLLPGRVAVEGEDHLAPELGLVEQEPAQDLDVLLAEGGAARGHRGRHARQMAGHHIGVSLDDHCLRALGDLALGEIDPVEHLALLVSGVSGVFRYFGPSSESSSFRAPNPITSPVASRIGQISRPRNRSIGPRRPSLASPPFTSSSAVNPRAMRWRVSASHSAGA
ncbi:hypothetical protein GCM10020220_085970 [Nonomuraea rubra]